MGMYPIRRGMQSLSKARGGKRKGAGRPKTEPTKNITFRVSEEDINAAKNKFGKSLNQKFREWLKSIING